VKSIEAREIPVPRTRIGTPVTDEWARAVLHELREVRNVILHRGGIVDERLASARLDGQLSAGEELQIEDGSLLDYGIAVHTYAGSAVSAVADALQVALVYED
jgi:hypothetical protein